MTEMNRRTLLAGVAATAATSAFVQVTAALPIASSPIPKSDLAIFVALSSKLTGIDQSLLSPNVDPTDVKSQYFTEAMNSGAGKFTQLLQAFQAKPTDETVAAIMDPHSVDQDMLFLARSIILAWYLGAWYDPKTLEAEAQRSPDAVANKLSTSAANDLSPSARRYNLVKCRIISPATYTQGWVWRVAQAHPMGYANLQFGYWSEQPPKLDDFVS